LDENSRKFQRKFNSHAKTFSLARNILRRRFDRLWQESAMRTRLWICAALALLAGGPVAAQEQEAMLRRIEVSNSGFDIMLATSKVPAAIVDLAESPEALVLHLAGGRLALVFESVEAMLDAIDTLRSPVGAAQVHHPGSSAAQPVAVYLVPKTPVTH
jgi:hypothetical protein